MARAADTRERILRGAEEVVIREGVSRLTLEAAAAEAGMSKGGVLYHFPSRAALVGAMVERFVVSFDADLAAFGADGGKPGDFTLAYVEASVSPKYELGDPRERRIGAALIASVASDPELLKPLRDRFDGWQAAIESDGIDPATATAIRYAVDGMWLCDVFELAPVRGEARAAFAARLRDLLDEVTGR